MPAARSSYGRGVLQADDGLAAEAALAKLFEDLAHAVQFYCGADPRGDRTVGQQARDLGQPLRRQEGIRARRAVVRSDLPGGEPPFVGCENRRDQAAAGPDEFRVTADGLRAADQV